MKLQELDRLRDLVIRSEIKQTDTLEEMVFKAYLKHENLKDTAKEINELNFRDNNGELIRTSSEEISEIIKDKNNRQVIKDKELYDYVKSTFSANKRKAMKRWG
ncbi:MAG: hypothetical protein HFJ02_00845 [Bacilli bacterium]|jgi:hypothetical protein|nr:hypothetical protein [Bacilli bacterium]